MKNSWILPENLENLRKSIDFLQDLWQDDHISEIYEKIVYSCRVRLLFLLVFRTSLQPLSKEILKNAPILAIRGAHTAENEPPKVNESAQHISI